MAKQVHYYPGEDKLDKKKVESDGSKKETVLMENWTHNC
jgi:hypothetical protein